MNIQIIFQIITHTPIWVWLLFGLLILKGISAKSGAKISIVKSLVVPAVFIIWGMESIVNKFQYVTPIILVYVVMLLVGSFASLFLYRNTRIYNQSGVLFQEGSIILLIIITINFMVKYILNVTLILNPQSYRDFSFNMIYGIICEFSVGLFFGGIIRIIRARKLLKE